MEIEAYSSLVVIIGADHGGVINRGAYVSVWIKSGGVDRDRVKFRSRYLVIGIGNASGGKVDQRMANSGKISLLLGGRRHNRGSGYPLAIAESFVVVEDKEPIFANGSTGCRPKLVLLERLHRGGE